MSADLSVFHQPITNLFSRAEEDLSKFRLNCEQIEFFHENGYLAGIKILSDEQIEILRKELSELMKPEQAKNSLWYEFNFNESADKSKHLFHALGAWRVSPPFHDLLWQPTFGVPATQLLGGAVRFWHDQLFVKPARDGGAVAWHQDYSYWTRTVPIAHLTCWIGLDDATEENGCLRYIPGSHNWNLLPRTDLAGDLNSIQTVLSDEQKRDFQPVAVELKAGEASFHHPLLVHGSLENFSARPRRGVVVNVFRDGVESNSDEPPLAGVPPVPKGEKMAGQFFPLLFP